MGVTQMGTSLGTVATWPFAAILIEYFGWEYSFFIMAIITGVFTIICNFSIFNEPHSNPRITNDEKQYIEANLGIGKSTGVKSENVLSTFCV